MSKLALVGFTMETEWGWVWGMEKWEGLSLSPPFRARCHSLSLSLFVPQVTSVLCLAAHLTRTTKSTGTRHRQAQAPPTEQHGHGRKGATHHINIFLPRGGVMIGDGVWKCLAFVTSPFLTGEGRLICSFIQPRHTGKTNLGV